ncbi:MAG: DUF4175 domain-containing protein, partial [Alphaproteobacteria bacterium]|nr:DUF4175 domain-containing protein [Alphaproteobacteria bacterium]
MRQTPADESARIKARLDTLANRGRAALGWEAAWPVLVGFLLVVATFLTVSWLGLWLYLPRWGRLTGLAIFALLALAALWPLIRLRMPSRPAALARVDRDSGLPNRPASTIEDRLAGEPGDQQTRALWRLHMRRSLESAGQLKVAAPSPRMVDRDRYALRALALLAVCSTAIIAGPERLVRITSAFDMQTAGSAASAFRIDAWIDPPAYTGRPPVLLRTAAAPDGASAENQSVRAPINSVVIVRSSQGAGVTAEVTGQLPVFDPDKEKTANAKGEGQDKEQDKRQGEKPAAPATRAQPASANSVEQKFRLAGNGQVVLKRLGRVIASFNIESIPDNAPV